MIETDVEDSHVTTDHSHNVEIVREIITNIISLKKLKLNF